VCPRIRDLNTEAQIHDILCVMVRVPATVAAWSEWQVLTAWLQRPWVRIPLEAWMFVLLFLCVCTVLCRYSPLRRADHSSKGVLPGVLIRFRNLWCQAGVAQSV
jgi:hypothetical protein